MASVFRFLEDSFTNESETEEEDDEDDEVTLGKNDE